MLSFWEKQSLLNYDIIIVGAGIVGLSTAVSLKKLKPLQRVLVLERGILPSGASTKNAGFSCIGSLTEIIDDLKSMSEAEVFSLVEMRYSGLKKLRQRLGDSNINYAENGSWELIKNSPEEISCVDKLDSINKKLNPLLKGTAFELHKYKDVKAQFGFNENHVEFIVKNCFEGELNTGKTVRRLIDLCLSLGVEIKTGAEVNKIEESTEGVGVVVKHNYLDEEICFFAQQVCICTNAFTRQFYPSLDVVPGRGQVLITKPIANLKFKGIYHFDKGYYYFRNLDGRVLFGGGRNLDFEGEQSTEFTYHQKIQADLEAKLKEIIIPGVPFEIEDRWTGIMAFGNTKVPILLRQSDRIVLGVRMGGMGVAIGTEVGERLAGLMLV